MQNTYAHVIRLDVLTSSKMCKQRSRIMWLSEMMADNGHWAKSYLLSIIIGLWKYWIKEKKRKESITIYFHVVVVGTCCFRIISFTSFFLRVWETRNWTTHCILLTFITHDIISGPFEFKKVLRIVSLSVHCHTDIHTIVHWCAIIIFG